MNRAERRNKNNNAALNAFREGVKAVERSEAELINICTFNALKNLVVVAGFTLQDKYSHYVKKDVNGRSRAQRFIEDTLRNVDALSTGYLTLEDIQAALKEETGWEPKIYDSVEEISVEV